MINDGPWFRRWLGNSVWPLNWKGWITLILGTAIQLPFFRMLFNAQPETASFSRAAMVLLAMNLAEWLFIRWKTAPD
jgi:hypothetical protein